MAKVTIHSTDKTVKVKRMVEIEEEVAAEIGQVRVYAVQYRNYPFTIHIQAKHTNVNRDYGFAFDIEGQANHKADRHLPSLAGTQQVYWGGALVVNGTSASLVGEKGATFDVPMTTLPQGV